MYFVKNVFSFFNIYINDLKTLMFTLNREYMKSIQNSKTESHIKLNTSSVLETLQEYYSESENESVCTYSIYENDIDEDKNENNKSTISFLYDEEDEIMIVKSSDDKNENIQSKMIPVNKKHTINQEKIEKLNKIDTLLSEGKSVPKNTCSLDEAISTLKQDDKKQNYHDRFINLIKSLSQTCQELMEFQDNYKQKFVWSHDVLKKELGSSYEHKLFILSLLWNDNTIDNENAFVLKDNGTYYFFDWLRIINKFMNETYKITKYSKHNNIKIQSIYIEFVKYLQGTKYHQWSKEIKKQIFIKYLNKLGYSKKRMEKGFFIANLILKSDKKV